IDLYHLHLALFPTRRSSDLDACISKLEKELVIWAKYDGWSLDKIQGNLRSLVPAVEMNEKYKTDQFYNFRVILSNFTVKNGFNRSEEHTSELQSRFDLVCRL